MSSASPAPESPPGLPPSVRIPNHWTARLSALDLRVARAVPPGGNWKNIPLDVPSRRLDSIRASFAAGEGSRSTYYGRLHPDFPAYTINTYFNRPGNGCHLHYDPAQDRVLSEREAARLQSFPDDFVFLGSHGAIHKQIGNAVPPLLAYQIARTLPAAGQFVDIFCGAGGLSLGFAWAGWEPLVASDLEPSFLQTHARNLPGETVPGDIRDPSVFARIVEETRRRRRPDRPLFVLGGPPCQGFSTAGKRRSSDDARNHLFLNYKALVDALRPDGFVFENVTGLLNMEKGAAFARVRNELQRPGDQLHPWILRAEQYGVPQRRTRLIVLSVPSDWPHPAPPLPLTDTTRTRATASLLPSLPPPVSVRAAIDDLPALHSGQDGSMLDYASPPRNAYQSLMRGRLSPADYLATLAPPAP